jgi:probable rRNA maturation factor
MAVVVDRARRIYLPPLRLDVTVREGVPPIVRLARLGRAIRAAALASRAPMPSSVGLVLTDDAELAALNREHMGKRGPTDVLSFPLLPAEAFGASGAAGRNASPPRDHRQSMGSALDGSPAPVKFVLPPGERFSLGDIAVSVERAMAQAREGRGGQDTRTALEPPDELLLLVIHGTLHLCGWDHAAPDEDREMRVLERRLLGEV